MKTPTQIDNESFYHVVRNTPLVSIDLVVGAPDGRVLLGLRKNEPARNFWFTYGGRIFKDETITSALRRISVAELNFPLDPLQGAFLGIFEHLYDTNYFDEPEFGTHYVVLAFRYLVDNYIPVNRDAQHGEHRWWAVQDILASPDVHKYAKAYFAKDREHLPWQR